jgi:hypothetical protein
VAVAEVETKLGPGQGALEVQAVVEMVQCPGAQRPEQPIWAVVVVALVMQMVLVVPVAPVL